MMMRSQGRLLLWSSCQKRSPLQLTRHRHLLPSGPLHVSAASMPSLGHSLRGSPPSVLHGRALYRLQQVLQLRFWRLSWYSVFLVQLSAAAVMLCYGCVVLVFVQQCISGW